MITIVSFLIISLFSLWKFYLNKLNQYNKWMEDPISSLFQKGINILDFCKAYSSILSNEIWGLPLIDQSDCLGRWGPAGWGAVYAAEKQDQTNLQLYIAIVEVWSVVLKKKPIRHLGLLFFFWNCHYLTIVLKKALRDWIDFWPLEL